MTFKFRDPPSADSLLCELTHLCPLKALSFHSFPLIGKSPSDVGNSADFPSFIAGQTLSQGIMSVFFWRWASWSSAWRPHICLKRGDVPAGLCHSYRITSHSGQFGDGERRAKGSHLLYRTATLLETVCGWHPHGPRNRSNISMTTWTQLNWPSSSPLRQRWKEYSYSLTPGLPIMLMVPWSCRCSGRRLTQTGIWTFVSHHPLVYKVAVACTLLTRADRICMSVPDRDAEKRHITHHSTAMGTQPATAQPLNQSHPKPQWSFHTSDTSCLTDAKLFTWAVTVHPPYHFRSDPGFCVWPHPLHMLHQWLAPKG